jgi:methylated-DNA-[protein]-cysteine S-methyltransferase
MMGEPEYFIIETPLGESRLYAEEGRPVLLALPGGPAWGRAAASPPPEKISRFMELVGSFFAGEDMPPHYLEDLIDDISATPFERAVLREVACIPRGETRSYGEIAELAGYPRAARAVGNIMHDNVFPLLIPCHRVIKGDGSIGGYGGSEHIKVLLLRLEGVDVPGEHGRS